jgi:hypothetical protein
MSAGPPDEAMPRTASLDAVEIRISVPSLVLLLTWLDEPENANAIRGGFRHAADVNRSTYGQADRQWFFRRGTRAPLIDHPLIDPPCKPISYDLILGYSPHAASRSWQRGEADKIIESRATNIELGHRDLPSSCPRGIEPVSAVSATLCDEASLDVARVDGEEL